MPGLAVHLLGRPHIQVDGKLLAVDTRMAIALLAYLAMTAEPQSRDTLAALLWPEYDQTNARANLRRTLSALKRGLGGRWVVAERELIRLERTPEVNVDVDDFKAALRQTGSHGHADPDVCPACLEPLSRAAALSRGPFLAGFTLTESPNFDDWQAYHAERLSRALANVLDRLSLALAAQGQYDAALASARRWLSLDPLHEPAHRRLMLVYAWAGERAAALRQYRDCVRVLDEELGVPPLAETTGLAEAIKANQEPLRPTMPGNLAEVSPRPSEPLPRSQPARSEPLSFEPLPTLHELPLVGRATEWAALLAVYERTSSQGQGGLIVLEGEAGIGKSRLAADFLAHVRSHGGTTLVIRSYEGETHLAYAPLAEALRCAVTAEWLASVPPHVLAEVGRLLPELAPENVQPSDGPGAQGRFIDALIQFILALMRSTETSAIFVDDMQWADQGTLDLLSALLRQLRRRSTTTLLAFRPEDLPAEARLRRLIADARRAGPVTHLTLARLSPDDSAQLVRTASPQLAEAAVTDVVRQTEGLPFFVVESAQALAEGRPVDELPGSVRELLHARLRDISETAAQVLASAAVLGRSFDFDTVRQVSGRSDEETVTALEELVRRGLIRESGLQPRFDFAHAWLRYVAYEEASLSRRRLLHRRVAEALASPESRRSPGALAGQIAYHHQQAGQDALAAEYFRLAGEHARSLYANADALSHFRAALALGHPASAELHEAIGGLETLAGQYTAALTSYELAAALCAQADLARVEHKLANLYCRRGEWDHAESHFVSAEAEFRSSAGGDQAERARLCADWALASLRRGDVVRATDLAERALGLASSADDAQALIAAHNAQGVVAGRRSEHDASRKHHERSLALAEMLDDRPGRVAALNNLALACRAAGEIDAAMWTTRQALELCVAQGDRHREAALHNNLADLLHAAGRSEEAMTHLKQAVRIFAEVGSAADPQQPEIWKLTEW